MSSVTHAVHLAPSPSVTAPTSFYIPSLDGVRILAFAIVFLSHLNNNARGMIGVTIFFFLSGYLITTLLRRENDLHGTISISRFYARRALRILPPFYLAIGLALLLIQFGAVRVTVTSSVGAVASYALFMGNYWLIYGPAQNQVLGPMWSLAVEEHFYLVFPLLFWLLNKRRLGYRTQACVLAGLAFLVLLWRVVLALHPSATTGPHLFYGTDCRLDSILFGCIMALAWNPVMDKRGTPPWWMVAAGVVGLLGSIVIHNDFYRSTFHYTLQGIALIPIFMALVTWGDTWFAWLNLRPVRYLGTLSYTLYLVHRGMIFSFLDRFHSRATGALVALLASLLLAVLMNLLVEQPLVRLRRRLAWTPPRCASLPLQTLR